MKNKLIIADSGPIFSLAIIDALELLNQLFGDVKIPTAVWEEISLNTDTPFYKMIELFFKTKTVEIKGFNDLTFVMDYGESESVILYRELSADFLLIDDKKARSIAESFGVRCIGTLGVLIAAKEKGFIKEIRPYFEKFLKNDRYYSIDLLNSLLNKYQESSL